MKIWKTLGIEETKDKRAITRAYREQLVHVNPEEKPEEFKGLRAAYEEAMRLADLEETETEKTPVDTWTEKLDAVYKDLRQRIDIASWKQLLSDELCMGLDTRMMVEEAMLKYFMQSFHLPQEVWLYLDQEFSFMERIEELKEHYPEDFIDLVIVNGIRYQPSLPYMMFEPGVDGEAVDEYYRLYHRMLDVNMDEFEEVAASLEQLKEKHPYGDSYIARVRLSKGDTEQLAKVEALQQKCPQDMHMMMAMISTYLFVEDYEKARDLAVIAKPLNKTNEELLKMTARAYAGTGMYREAVETLNDLMRSWDGDRRTVMQIDDMRKDWNEKLIAQYEQQLAENSDNNKVWLDYAWCCMQNDHMEQAEHAMNMLKEEETDPFDYYNLKASLGMELHHEDVEENLARLIAIIRTLEDDGTEKTRSHMNRLAEMLIRQCTLFLARGAKEEAYAALDEAISLRPDDPGNLTNAVQIYYSEKKYDKASALVEHLVEIHPGSYHSHLLKAMVCFEMYRDNEAFAAINQALELDGSELMEYLIKLRILVRNKANEQAQELIKFLEDNGFAQEITVRWCKAQLARNMEEEPEKLLEMYRSMEKDLEEEAPPWAAKYYWEMASVLAEVKDKAKDYSREDLLVLLEKGLSYDSEDFDCLEYKAWLLKKEKRNEESKEIYHQLELRPRYNTYIERQLAELYYRDLNKYADKALHYYEILQKEDETDSSGYFYTGMCNFRMNRIEEAEAAFLKEQECDPNDVDGYYRLAYVYLYQNRLEEALQMAERTIEISRDRKDDVAHLWDPKIIALRRMGRAEEAIEAVRDCQEHNPEHGGYNKNVFDICLQFGMYDRIAKLLKAWSRVTSEVQQYCRALVELQIALGHYGRAQMYLFDRRQNMDPEDVKELEAIIRLHKNKIKGMSDYRRLQLNNAKKNNRENMALPLADFAMDACHEGLLEEARDAAEKALVQLDDTLSGFTNSEALYRARRAGTLAVLGRFEEARAEIDRTLKLPLCERCEYCRCKDAYLMLSEVALIEGDLDTAKQALDQVAEIDKYECSAVRNALLLQMKGNKKC